MNDGHMWVTVAMILSFILWLITPKHQTGLIVTISVVAGIIAALDCIYHFSRDNGTPIDIIIGVLTLLIVLFYAAMAIKYSGIKPRTTDGIDFDFDDLSSGPIQNRSHNRHHDDDNDSDPD